MVKFFPNDAACLEPVTFLLHKVEAEGRQKTTVDDEKVLLLLFLLPPVSFLPRCPPALSEAPSRANVRGRGGVRGAH